MASYWLSKGEGYYQTDKYPIGGCFRRVRADRMRVEVTRVFDPCHGCTAEGKADTGERVAFDARRAYPISEG